MAQSTSQYTCPSCGAGLNFRTSYSTWVVCPYCQSAVVRNDRDVEAIGKVADLPEEMSPVMVGTGLSWRMAHYSVAGRLRVAWADGAWNEWYLVAGDKQAWLAEAQGFFAVSEAAPWPESWTTLPALDEMREIGGRKYRTTDIKSGTCVGSEGELPFRAPKGRVATYYDMIDDRGGFASIEDGPDGRALYLGAYVGFDDLLFTGLRPIEGWTPPAQPPQRGQDPFVPPKS